MENVHAKFGISVVEEGKTVAPTKHFFHSKGTDNVTSIFEHKHNEHSHNSFTLNDKHLPYFSVLIGPTIP